MYVISTYTETCTYFFLFLTVLKDVLYHFTFRVLFVTNAFYFYFAHTVFGIVSTNTSVLNCFPQKFQPGANIGRAIPRVSVVSAVVTNANRTNRLYDEHIGGVQNEFTYNSRSGISFKR